MRTLCLIAAVALVAAACNPIRRALESPRQVAYLYVGENPAFLDSLCAAKFQNSPVRVGAEVIDSSRLQVYLDRITRDSVVIDNLLKKPATIITRPGDTTKCPAMDSAARGEAIHDVLDNLRDTSLAPKIRPDTVADPKTRAENAALMAQNKALSDQHVADAQKISDQAATSSTKTWWIIGLAAACVLFIIIEVLRLVKIL